LPSEKNRVWLKETVGPEKTVRLLFHPKSAEQLLSNADDAGGTGITRKTRRLP
jgi:hypothetical protein